MTEKHFCCDFDDRGCPDTADIDTSLCSDFDDFEKLSIPCSEGDEAVVDATDSEHMLKSADTKQTSETAYTPPLPFEVRKPPVMFVLPALTEVCRQSPASGRVKRSPMCNNLIEIANNIDKKLV